MNRHSRRSGRQAPDSPIALTDLLRGLEHHERNEFDQAAAQYRKVLALDAGHAQAWHYLALTELQQGRGPEAEQYLRRAIAAASAPAAKMWVSLGEALAAQGKHDEAIAAYRGAAKLGPANASIWLNMGVSLQSVGQLRDAVHAYRRAAALAPDMPEVWSNLGFALDETGDLTAALEVLKKALALRPNYAEAWFNLGNTLRGLKLPAEAEKVFIQARTLRPDWADPLCNLALLHMAQGDLRRGWPGYELRFSTTRRPVPRRPFGQPQWRGEALAGRSLLVWGEQGIGDEILYGAMLRDLRQRIGPFLFECDPRLAPLFADALPGVTILSRADPADLRAMSADMQIPLGSLGAILRPSLAAFPQPSPSLAADAGRAQSLRAQYRGLGKGPVIGLSWKSRAYIGAHKSTGLEQWLPILQGREAVFLSLQYGDVAADLALANSLPGVAIHTDDGIDPTHDLTGLAAQIAACDLVISVSNSTVHLAGALGKPVWAIIPRAAGQLWYWFEDREDSPWYPGLRLFRQTDVGDWGGPVQAVARALDRWQMEKPE